MNRLICLAAAGCTAAFGAFAQEPPQGIFQWNGCTDLSEYVDTRVEIDGNRIAVHEGACRLTNPVAIRDMEDAYLYDGECWVEGSQLTERFMIMPGHGGRLVVVREGRALTYEYCGPG